MWDEMILKRNGTKCKNRSNIIIEDDKINTILNDISLGILTKSKHIFEKFYPRLDYEKLTGECSNLFSENPPNEAYINEKITY